MAASIRAVHVMCDAIANMHAVQTVWHMHLHKPDAICCSCCMHIVSSIHKVMLTEMGLPNAPA